MRVTTDSKHYENMAAKIREKTGTDATYKPSEMPSGVDAVYKAGQSSMVDESKLIPKTVSGSYISVDDVSEIPHSVGCKVESVNLCPEEVYSGYYYDSGGSAATSSANYIRVAPITVKPSTTYTFSSNLAIYTIWYYGSDGGILRQSTAYGTYKFTFATPENCTELRISLHNTSGAADTVAFEYAMLNRGTTALPYTPYVSPESVKVTRCGRNLLNPHNLGSGEIVEYNGVPCYKYTDKNADTGAWVIRGCFKENTQYSYAIKQYREDGAALSKTIIHVRYTDGTTVQANFTESGNISTYTTAAGKTVDVISAAYYGYLTAYLDLSVSCLHEGAEALPYEPYNGQTLTPAADGTVEGMTSVSPHMNIFSDTEGVNIEATYNKSYGMQTEYDRFWDSHPTAKGTTVNGACLFAGAAWNNATFKPKYDILPNTCYMIFRGCEITDIVESVKKQGVVLDFSQATSFQYAFMEAKLTHVGELYLTHQNFTKAIHHTSSLFSYSQKLHTIDKMIVNNEGTTLISSDAFNQTIALKNITFEGVIGCSVNFQHSPLTKASISNIIEHLSTTATGQTLTLKLSAVNTAFETSSGAADGSTSAEFAALVATKTNWTITMV